MFGLHDGLVVVGCLRCAFPSEKVALFHHKDEVIDDLAQIAFWPQIPISNEIVGRNVGVELPFERRRALWRWRCLSFFLSCHPLNPPQH